jgi:hypothetical protein
VSASLSKISLEPFRVENESAHFDVSEADFGEFKAQIEDAIAFLQFHNADVKLMMGEPGASGALDFAIEWRDVAAQFDNFPATLVREAGNLGLSLELSHYPATEESDENA